MAWVETRITRTTQPQDAAQLDRAEIARLGLVSGFLVTKSSLNEIESGALTFKPGTALVESAYQNGLARRFTETVSGIDRNFALPTKSVNATGFTFWTRLKVNIATGEPGLISRSGTTKDDFNAGGGSILLWRNSATFDMRVAGADYNGAGSWNLGQWYDIKIVGSASSCRLYVNDVLTIDGGAAPSAALEQFLHFGDVSGGGAADGAFDTQGILLANKAWTDNTFNPWQIFEPEVSRIWVDDAVSAGGAATVIPIGVQATGSVGTPSATGAARAAPAGVSASSAVGTPIAVGGASIPATALPAGVQATAAIGTVSARSAAVAQPAGVTASGAVGTPVAIAGTSIPATVLPAGVQATSAVGTPTAKGAAIAQPLGVVAIGYVGTPTIATGVSGVAVCYPAGVQAIGQVGTLIATGAAWTAVVGVQAVGSVGTPFAYEGDLPVPPIITEPNESAYYQRVAADILAGRVSGPQDALFLRLARRRSNGY